MLGLAESDLGDLDGNFFACLGRAGDTVNDRLVEKDLAGRDGSGCTLLDRIHEGADLQIEQIVRGLEDRNGGFCLPHRRSYA